MPWLSAWDAGTLGQVCVSQPGLSKLFHPTQAHTLALMAKPELGVGEDPAPVRYGARGPTSSPPPLEGPMG